LWRLWAAGEWHGSVGSVAASGHEGAAATRLIDSVAPRSPVPLCSPGRATAAIPRGGAAAGGGAYSAETAEKKRDHTTAAAATGAAAVTERSPPYTSAPSCGGRPAPSQAAPAAVGPGRAGTRGGAAGVAVARLLATDDPELLKLVAMFL